MQPARTSGDCLLVLPKLPVHLLVHSLLDNIAQTGFPFDSVVMTVGIWLPMGALAGHFKLH